MNIQKIKQRASEVLVNYKDQYLRILIIMMLINLIPTIFSNFSSSVAYVISIIFLAFDHGYIVSSLKIVRNNGNALNDNDAVIGFTQFRRLFPTYLLQNVISFAVMFVYFMICFIIFMIFGSSLIDFSYLYNVNISTETMINYLVQLMMTRSSFVVLILIMILLAIIIMVVLSLFLFAVPYLLEEYHMGAGECVKESFSMMKDHLWDLVKLELSFWGWMILLGIVEIILSSLLSIIPFGDIIATVVTGLIAIYTYAPKYHLSMAIFFEEFGLLSL